MSAITRRASTHRLEHYEPYDYQKRFHNALGHQTLRPAVQRALIAGNQCLTPWAVIQTGVGERRVAEMLGEASFDVRSWDGDFRCERKASSVFLKGIEQAFRFRLDNGEVFECSGRHRVLSAAGWISAYHLIRLLDALHSMRKRGDLRASCGEDVRLNDPRLPSLPDSGQAWLPQEAYVPVCGQDGLSEDAEGTRSRYSHAYPTFDRLTTFDDDPHRLLALFENFSGRWQKRCAQSCLSNNSSELLSAHELVPHQEGTEVDLGLSESSAFAALTMIGGNKILSWEGIGFQPIVDFEVAATHCYEAAGAIHHNTGKTTCAAMEAAIHLTGRYPDWWKGNRVTRPNVGLVGGLTNESVRDICQKELFGEPTDDKQLGTGTIPIDCLGKIVRKAGVPNAIDSAMIKHVSGGWSRVTLRAYEQGAKKHMGSRIDWGWPDEEPPEDIWAQYLRATLATRGFLFTTFTPEDGVTKVVYGFLNDLKPGQAVIRATWDDAGHMNHDRRQQLLMAIPAHQREMREKGIPLMGSGLVYQVPEEEIVCDPIEIPAHWPRVCAVDFGIDHGFAAVWIAWDRDRDIAYVVDAYKAEGEKMSEHVSQLNRRGNWIPVIWPHDGLNREKSSGVPLAEAYRKEGANMWHEPFSNPPAPGVEEGKGGNSVEYGVENILNRMQTKRVKIFKTLTPFLEEWRMYHREDGKIVKLFDDLMDAFRYACLSLRHATTQTFRIRKSEPPRGPTNW